MKYANNRSKANHGKMFYIMLIIVVAIIAAFVGSISYRMWYEKQLQPVSSEQRLEIIEIPPGTSVQEIAKLLEDKQVIRSSRAMITYARNNDLFDGLKAGVYQLDASKSTPDIVNIIAQGKALENAVTILPGKRIDEIRSTLIKAGFSEADVDTALDPAQYKGHPALVAKPTDQSLEGYLYPETFNASSKTTPKDIVEQSLDEMAEVLTPELNKKIKKQGLGIHEAVTMASIVLKESSNPEDQRIIANVFFNRLQKGMNLGSDPTYQYIADTTGQPRSANIDSPYNTRKYGGLPPGPIGNVTKSSLEAVANPASTDYLYFVAGDDGNIYYSKTLQEHEENVKNYCKELCANY